MWITDEETILYKRTFLINDIDGGHKASGNKQIEN